METSEATSSRLVGTSSISGPKSFAARVCTHSGHSSRSGRAFSRSSSFEPSSPSIEPRHVQHGRSAALAVRVASSCSWASRSRRSSRSWWQVQQRLPGRRVHSVCPWRPYSQVLSSSGTSMQTRESISSWWALCSSSSRAAWRRS
ncbi:hypothetical protein [Kitasatospora aureofaciens]|uniref:hypothetical protein n=1 Tax=Kitasatospora aureofaciens TaxID=1894 RepID=UPI0037C8F831